MRFHSIYSLATSIVLLASAPAAFAFESGEGAVSPASTSSPEDCQTDCGAFMSVLPLPAEAVVGTMEASESIITEMHRLANVERAKYGLAPMRMSRQLNIAAQRHSQDMGVRKYFKHVNPDRIDHSARIYASGYPAGKAGGEIIGWGYRTAASAIQGWMESPDHKVILLNPTNTEAGWGFYANGFYSTGDFGHGNTSEGLAPEVEAPPPAAAPAPRVTAAPTPRVTAAPAPRATAAPAPRATTAPAPRATALPPVVVPQPAAAARQPATPAAVAQPDASELLAVAHIAPRHLQRTENAGSLENGRLVLSDDAQLGPKNFDNICFPVKMDKVGSTYEVSFEVNADVKGNYAADDYNVAFALLFDASGTPFYNYVRGNVINNMGLTVYRGTAKAKLKAPATKVCTRLQFGARRYPTGLSYIITKPLDSAIFESAKVTVKKLP